MDFTVDGRKVFASTGGHPFDPERPVVVFVHGAGMDHTAWMLQARYFAHHGRSVLNVDLPGHGRSDGPPLRTIADLAAWLLRFLDAAHAPKAALVGHSMGSLVALEAAAQAPAKIWALALLGTTTRMAVHPDLLKAAQANDHAAIDLIASWAYGQLAHIGGSRSPGGWMLGSGIRLLERAPPGALAACLSACQDYTGALTAAAKIVCPTLLLLGELERMTPPAGAREVGAGIPGARTVILPRTGHMMMVEQPDQTIDALAEII